MRLQSLFPFRNFSVSPKEQIGPTEIAMQTLCFPFVTFRSHRKSKSVPPSLPDQLSGKLITKSVLLSLCNRSHRDSLCPNPNHIGPTELHVSPTENSNGH